ncbi:hypothetical protein CR513_08788, partial [Mucuna pruriens]
MKDRFIPSYYAIGLYNKLQRLYLGGRSMEDYHKELEMTLMRVQVEDFQETPMARFLHGYNSLEDIVHKATKGIKKEGHKMDKSHNMGSDKQEGQKEETINPSPSSYISSSSKYFKCLDKGQIASQCPNNKTMVLRENGESICSSESESSNGHTPYEGDLLIVKRLVNNIVGDEAKSQKENIFHSKCLVLRKLCFIIIDDKSNVSVASLRLVKLGTSSPQNLTSCNG